MFLYNLKLNGKRIIQFTFILMFLVIFLILSFGIYKIFLDSNKDENSSMVLTDTIKTDDVFEITPQNYANILQAVTDDIDSYVGTKIHFTGYVYRLIDFKENEFVLARDMKVNKNSNQTLVIGFLCESSNAKNFKDGTWVDLTGEVIKGDYYGDIAKIKVTTMSETTEPDVKLAEPLDNTYIPTVNMF